MQLLFILSAQAEHQDLLGMAQLSAAFGQQVKLLSQRLLNADEVQQCLDAGIDNLYCSTFTEALAAGVSHADSRHLQQLLQAADRVVRL